jgi:hypothetical protein
MRLPAFALAALGLLFAAIACHETTNPEPCSPTVCVAQGGEGGLGGAGGATGTGGDSSGTGGLPSGTGE